MSSLQVKRRKLQIITDEASKEGIDILEEVRRSCISMINILGGILGTDTKGKYYPLANLPELWEKDSKFVNAITAGIEKFHKTVEILDNIDALEAGR
jgi:hypothetical protein